MIYSKIEGTGTPFLVIHGFLGMSDNWKTFASQFSSLGFEMHLLDMRNHGRSFHSNLFNYNLMVQDVFAYCKANNLEKFILLGHSMGGKIAMNFACDHPEMIEKLIIADISPRKYEPHHQDVMQALNAVDFKQVSSRKEAEEIMGAFIKDVGTLQFLMKNVHRVSPETLGFRFNLEAFNQNEEAIGEALSADKHFYGETLFVKGERSKYIQPFDEKEISQHFPNSSIKTVLNSGHWVHAENPQAFYEIIKKFIIN